MKASTLVAIILGFAAVFGAFYWEGGSFDMVFWLPPMLIVFGGTLMAGMAGSSFEQFKRMPFLIKLSFNPRKYNIEKIISQIVMFAGMARKEGILSIEPKLNEVEHPFLKKLFEICIDGADPETLGQIVTSEVSHITDRHEANINYFLKLGGYSPTMGIIGTVMGLIATLASAGQDPNVLIHHIASAFIATMWGILMANMFWLPIGDKLQTMHDEEMSIIQVMLDGVNGVQLGETPTVIRARLISVFPLSRQLQYASSQRRAGVSRLQPTAPPSTSNSGQAKVKPDIPVKNDLKKNAATVSKTNDKKADVNLITKLFSAKKDKKESKPAAKDKINKKKESTKT